MGVTSGCGDYSSMYSLHAGGKHTTGMLSCLSLLTAEECKNIDGSVVFERKQQKISE